jgi:hypothetical protein
MRLANSGHKADHECSNGVRKSVIGCLLARECTASSAKNVVRLVALIVLNRSLRVALMCATDVMPRSLERKLHEDLVLAGTR